MDFIQGRTLRQVLQASSKQSIEFTTLVMKKLLMKISQMHFHGIIHRDLKPENLIFTQDDSQSLFDIKILDFGLSINSSTRTGEFELPVGTLPYMAPEVLEKLQGPQYNGNKIPENSYSKISEKEGLKLIYHRCSLYSI